jgi:drug/metabolite transporter (DMT)-like permease
MFYWRSVLLVFLGACSYGMLSTFVKLAYKDGFTSAEVSGSQMFIGACLMWMLTVILGRGKTSPRQWLLLIGVGVGTGLTGIFYYQSLRYIPASIAIVLLFQFTWIGVLAESILTRTRPGMDRVAALVLLFVGTLLAGGVLEGELRNFSWMGLVYGLLSAVTYAFFIICSGRAATSVNPWLRTSFMLAGAVLITFIVYPPTFLVNGSLAHGLLKWGILLALFGAIVPTLFFTFGTPHIGGSLATILGAAELPMAVFMSSFILKEQVGISRWLGVVIILAGITIPEIAQRRKKRLKQAEQ